MKPLPHLERADHLAPVASLSEYFVVVGFAGFGDAMAATEITYVCDADFALELAQENEPELSAIAAYRLAPCSEGDGFRRPALIATKGAIPPGWERLPKDFLFNL